MGAGGILGLTHRGAAGGRNGVCRTAQTPRAVHKEDNYMAISKLMRYLDEHNVKYTTIQHSPAFTAQEIAASAHIPGRDMAKTVIVKMDGDMKMVVMPASEVVDMERLRHETGARQIEIAAESEFRDRFPESDVGAMPPFGNLFNRDTIVADSLTADHEIAFNAGSHSELIRMQYSDFERLVAPKVLPVGRRSG